MSYDNKRVICPISWVLYIIRAYSMVQVMICVMGSWLKPWMSKRLMGVLWKLSRGHDDKKVKVFLFYFFFLFQLIYRKIKDK